MVLSTHASPPLVSTWAKFYCARMTLLMQRCRSAKPLTFWRRGPAHPEVASCCGCLGSLLEEKGDTVGAKSYFQRKYDIRKKLLGPTHSKTISAQNELKRLEAKEEAEQQTRTAEEGKEESERQARITEEAKEEAEQLASQEHAAKFVEKLQLACQQRKAKEDAVTRCNEQLRQNLHCVRQRALVFMNQAETFPLEQLLADEADEKLKWPLQEEADEAKAAEEAAQQARRIAEEDNDCRGTASSPSCCCTM